MIVFRFLAYVLVLVLLPCDGSCFSSYFRLLFLFFVLALALVLVLFPGIGCCSCSSSLRSFTLSFLSLALVLPQSFYYSRCWFLLVFPFPTLVLASVPILGNGSCFCAISLRWFILLFLLLLLVLPLIPDVGPCSCSDS